MINKRKITAGAVVCFALVLAWLVFSPSERDLLDAEAKRLCAIDGGLKVFEAVTLPPENFNEYGQPLIPIQKDEKNFGYFSRGTQVHLSGPPDSAEGPNLTRTQYQVVRSSDGKVMGELTFYGRAGGCLLDGYLQSCGFRCPKYEGWDLERSVLLKGESK